MDFRIADTFTASLARLTGEEQKAVKTTAFDLQLDPAGTGMSFHKLDGARDKKFWSVRVSRDIRLIVHRAPSNILLCYVDHHDKAYAWAERRKLETHPVTGAAQLVEIRERFQEIVVPIYVTAEAAATHAPPPLVFAGTSDEMLLGYGVPAEWLADIRLATEDTILTLVDHLPSEAAEALLELATGGTPRPLVPVVPVADPFAHPDAQRRFRVVTDVDELTRALDFPWDRWAVFLHPAQREIVDTDFGGPARVSGSAGTGKTIVALHRAVALARNDPDARVLLTTFSEPLANALRVQLRRLLGNQPRLGERVEVHTVESIARRLHERNIGASHIASAADVRDAIEFAARQSTDQPFATSFLVSEWEEVVDAWRLASWDDYRDVARLGRKTRLPEKRRAAAWATFERARTALATRELITTAELYARVSAHLAGMKRSPFDYVVADESQDVSVPQLRFLAALGRNNPDSLFFAGDLGQRIFQLPFSWRSLGVDVRGRSTTLRVNYRTSHQIRMQADRLLAGQATDVDGNLEDRTNTVSVFNGPSPEIIIVESREAEGAAVARWLTDCVADGVKPDEIGMFVRSSNEIPRARAAVDAAGLPFVVLDERVETKAGRVSLSTMNLAKGLEFRAVAVMACDDEIVPQQERIDTVTDDSDLEEVYNTERHLLYVACTRARDQLLVSGVAPASEFLQDIRAGQ